MTPVRENTGNFDIQVTVAGIFLDKYSMCQKSHALVEVFQFEVPLLEIGTSSPRFDHRPCGIRQSEKSMTFRRSGKSSDELAGLKQTILLKYERSFSMSYLLRNIEVNTRCVSLY